MLSKNAFHVDPKLWRSQQACEPRLGRFPKGQSVHTELAGAVAPGGAGPGPRKPVSLRVHGPAGLESCLASEGWATSLSGRWLPPAKHEGLA